MCDSIINEHVSIREAVILTGMCAQTLRKLGDQQRIKCYKTHSGQRKFDKASLIELVKSTVSLSNTINNVAKSANDVCDDDNKEGNPSTKDKEYLFYDTNDYKLEKKFIDEFITNHPSAIVVNNINNIIDICLASKKINIYISISFYNNTKEYGMLKHIVDKCGNNITVI
jgi:hypothetical protein